MVKCVLLTKSSIKEIKLKYSKKISVDKQLDKKTIIKGKDFSKINSYNYENHKILIYGYIDGEEKDITTHYIPGISDDTILYGDLVACKINENDNLIDLNTEEYEKFYICLVEGGNLSENYISNSDNETDDDDDDDDDDELNNNSKIVKMLSHSNSNNLENDIVEIEIDDDDLLDDNLDEIITFDNEKDFISNSELQFEEYNYKYLE